MLTRRNFIALSLALLAVPVASAADKKMAFEIYPDAKGEFRWRLLDGEGTNVANSGQGYVKKADCKKMVENFKDDISKYTIEVYEDTKKESRFRLKAKNGQNVGSSTGSYKAKADADKVVAAIQKGAKDATVTEKEAEKK
ncbi:YegP family protein [Limnoglobus roseus]|uniref:DUF1508 domain-containing protein n=1 Tax=Limnoglobus roseus TaxID=2598579 RepID=A0A5C1AJP2_9BACT|nr:YegP family protein [Limnoglobus roseus]QEL18413.1 hypothetical protein PX52LOC_05437 [Limnoglobus roseus]